VFWGLCTVELLPGQRGQTKPHPSEVKTHTQQLYTRSGRTHSCFIKVDKEECVPPLWQMWTWRRFSWSFWDSTKTPSII